MTHRGSFTAQHNSEFDAALEARPPVIRWAKGKHGIKVAVDVRDPHAEQGFEAQMERARENADRQEREEQRQAAVLAEQRRLDTTRLMISARTEI